MSTLEVAALLEAREWKYAKSMPECPHFYTLRWDWPSDEEFVQVITFIKEHGETEFYGKAKSRVLIVNGFKYWSGIGAFRPPEPFGRWDIVIINRKPVTDAEVEAMRAERDRPRERKPRGPRKPKQGQLFTYFE